MATRQALMDSVMEMLEEGDDEATWLILSRDKYPEPGQLLLTDEAVEYLEAFFSQDGDEFFGDRKVLFCEFERGEVTDDFIARLRDYLPQLDISRKPAEQRLQEMDLPDCSSCGNEADKCKRSVACPNSECDLFYQWHTPEEWIEIHGKNK